jgi:chaperone modulatory protein CbpM
MVKTSLVVVDARVVDDDMHFTLDELARACATDAARLMALADAGLVEPIGSGPADWRFGGQALGRARTALRLARDFELSADAAALVVELLDEIDRLRSRLRRAGLD